MFTLRKIGTFLRLGGRSPLEGLDRLEAKLEVWRERRTKAQPLDRFSTAAEALGLLQTAAGGFVDPEESTGALEEEIQAQLKRLQGNAPFSFAHNGDLSLARLAYAACRLLRPAVVVETGVAYGVTTAYLLQALEENGRGNLHSIDLPPLAPEADRYVGALVQPGCGSAGASIAEPASGSSLAFSPAWDLWDSSSTTACTRTETWCANSKP